uniref:Uncharacterized protein n=1 Tax=Anguilla anguilla TaxID=7936 RepID=A0A0E9T296_ANGAN
MSLELFPCPVRVDGRGGRSILQSQYRGAREASVGVATETPPPPGLRPWYPLP